MSPIEKGSTVLVTGANGFIASHIVDQLLQLDYKVRGTVRTEEKGKWVQNFFDDKYGKGKLELVVVPAMEVKGAFDDAVKGQYLLMLHLGYTTDALQAVRASFTSLPISPFPRIPMRSFQMSLPVSIILLRLLTRNLLSSALSSHPPLLLRPTLCPTRSSPLTSHHTIRSPSTRLGPTRPTLRMTELGMSMALARPRESRLSGNMSKRRSLTSSATQSCPTQTSAQSSRRPRMLALLAGCERSSTMASMRYSSKFRLVRILSSYLHLP
jgi:hypothetical protein